MPRFNNAELESIENRLRGLEKKVDLLTKEVKKGGYVNLPITPIQAEPTLGEINSIEYDTLTYTLLSVGIYRTPKDGITDNIQGQSTVGHGTLNLKSDGTGTWKYEAKANFNVNDFYRNISNKAITWEIADGKVVISG